MKQIVKRKGHTEAFDERKVYASVYAAALNSHYGERKAEKLADQVTKKISVWVKKQKKLDSSAIRQRVLQSLTDKDVALLYTHHLDVC